MVALGTLIVVVMRARNLPNKVKIGKQNPYASLQVGIHKKKTTTIERGGQVPEWDEEFRFEILDDGDDEGEIPAVAVVTKAGGVLPVLEGRPGSMPAGSPRRGEKGGKKALKIACWADDSKDPTLIGEITIDLEPILKKGANDSWWPLEKKGREAGELYLEMTFYSNKPPPPKPAVSAIQRPASAYGGAGSRVEGSDSDEEDGDGSGGQGRHELEPNYPDSDINPLARSMSNLSVRSSLPPTPTHAPHSLQNRPSSPYAASSYDRRASGSSYGPLPTPGPSYQHQQAQGVYGGGGEYTALAQQHYAAQAYAAQAPTPTPSYHAHAAPIPPPSQWPAPPAPPQPSYGPPAPAQTYGPPPTFSPPPATLNNGYNPYATYPSAAQPPPTVFSPPPIPPSFYPPPQPPSIPNSTSFTSLGFPPPPPPPPELSAHPSQYSYPPPADPTPTHAHYPYQAPAQPDHNSPSHAYPYHQPAQQYAPIPPPTPPTWQPGQYNAPPPPGHYAPPPSQHGTLPRPPSGHYTQSSAGQWAGHQQQPSYASTQGQHQPAPAQSSADEFGRYNPYL